MALNPQNPDDDKDVQGMNNPQNVPNQAQPPQLSQGLASSSSIPTAPNKPVASSGTFTNIRSYLDANKGNRIGSAASQRLENTATGAQKSITQGSKAFEQKVDQGSLANRQQAVQDVANISQSARNVTYTPPVAPAQPQATTPATPAPAVPILAEDQTNRFKEVINAKYQGPQSLREAGLFDKISGRVKTAQDRLNQTNTSQGRESFLKDMFGQNREYTLGQNKLDSLLLNTDSNAISNLQAQKQNIGNLSQNLDKAQNVSTNLSRARSEEIQGIQDKARETFTKEQQAERDATDARLSKVVENWDQLPNYYKDLIRNKEKNNQNIQNQARAELSNKYSPVINQAANANKTLADLQKQKKQLEVAVNIGTGFNMEGTGGVTTKDNTALYKSQLADVNNKIASTQQVLQSPEYKQYQAELDAVNKANLNQLILSGEEAALLGVGSGAGLYNLGEDAIRTAAAEKDRLVSKNETYRQLALRELAGLDAQKRLDTNTRYSDLDRAGTQDALDALDVAATQQAVREAEENFAQSAEGADLTGTGKKKVSRGNAFGKKTKTYYAQQQGNVADMLRSGGYDVNAVNDQGINPSLLQDKDLLARYLGATNTAYDQDAQKGGSALEGAATGAGIGAGVGGAPGAAIGATAGAMIGGNTADITQAQTDVLNELAEKYNIPVVGQVGKGIQDARSFAGNTFNQTAGKALDVVGLGSLGKGIGGAIGGIDASAMKSFGNAKAKQNAIADLQNKYASYLAGQGFENRVNVLNTKDTLSRTEGLRALLSKLDKTNLG